MDRRESPFADGNRVLDAVSVLAAAQDDRDLAKRLIGEVIDEHRGPELIFGLAELANQLLVWLSEETGEPPQRLLQGIALVVSDESESRDDGDE